MGKPTEKTPRWALFILFCKPSLCAYLTWKLHGFKWRIAVYCRTTPSANLCFLATCLGRCFPQDVYASKHSKAYFATEGRLERKQARMENIMDGSVIYSKELSMRYGLGLWLVRIRLAQGTPSGRVFVGAAVAYYKNKRTCARNANAELLKLFFFFRSLRNIHKITADWDVPSPRWKKVRWLNRNALCARIDKKASNSTQKLCVSSKRPEGGWGFSIFTFKFRHEGVKWIVFDAVWDCIVRLYLITPP